MLFGRANARLLLSLVGSGELLTKSRWSGSTAACQICKSRRRLMMTIMRSVISVAAENSSKGMISVCTLILNDSNQ